MSLLTCLQAPVGVPVLEGAASLLEFNRHRLRVVAKLGDGLFGTVSGSRSSLRGKNCSCFHNLFKIKKKLQ